MVADKSLALSGCGKPLNRSLAAARRLSSSAAANNDSSLPQKAPVRERQPDEEVAPETGPTLSGRLKDKSQLRLEQLKLWESVATIKRLGYRMASLDPLRLKAPEALEELTWKHRLVEELSGSQELIQTEGFLRSSQSLMSVSELIHSVRSIYVDNECGLEFEHLSNEAEVEWLTSKWETFNELFHFERRQEQEEIAKLLLECEAFDHFMAAKYPTTKRYGCEGAESMLVLFDEILRLCHLGSPTGSAHLGEEDRELLESIGRIDDVIIGMPHRGRLNLLACLLGFEPGAIFNKCRGECELDTREAWMATGDVLSHLSTNVRFVYGLDKLHIGLSRDSPEPINVSLLPNPSHLELCSPVCVGTARGRARNVHYNYHSSPRFALEHEQVGHKRRAEAADSARGYCRHFKSILPIQVHGDASVAGQGIVQETLQMANLPSFTVGGSLHLVLNNQIGYTTDSSLARSSRFSTDVFKLLEAPIIHVNGENIESLLRATRLALAYRQKFAKDVVIELVCYRQHGHNELDEPSFTQPIMYETIRKRKSIPQSYCDKIKLEPTKRQQIVDTFKERLNEQFKESSKMFMPNNDNYRNFVLPTEYHRKHICNWQTGCRLEELRAIGLASVETPAGFKVHPNLERVLVAERRQRFSPDKPLPAVRVDWASAEILAFGSLLNQNHNVRLAGQDVARGTFSTRHAMLFDQKSGRPFVPLNCMASSSAEKSPAGQIDPPARLEVCNTILSEEAALAFEFGFAMETCGLTIWEAQFGDFFNTAQSVIDTLVSSSETKWLRQSALTLLLPHGLDGAGPEHSSAHLERFLQMSSSSMGPSKPAAELTVDTEANTNWSLCFPTLPSQYFHLLRRQLLRPFRKPLVVMSPKSIFRHPDCISPLEEFNLTQTFRPVLDDPNVDDAQQVDTIVLCSGKIYFGLKEEKLKNNMNNVALIRIEELCPFPINSIVKHLKRYMNATDKIVWFQEEHKNQGAYSHVERRMSQYLNVKLHYIGRPESELPAVGSSTFHKRELEQIFGHFRELKRKSL